MFGLSGSRSTSRSTGQSQSSSFSFGNSSSSQGSASRSASGGFSRGGSESASAGRSRQSIAFEDVFARLFNRAEGTADSFDATPLTDASNQLFTGGVDFLGQLGGDAGTAFLEERLAGAGNLEAAQLGVLQEDIGQLFREELNPAITSEAVGAGQLGGGRQGVAQGRAVDAAAEAFTKGAVDIRTANQAQLDQLAAGVAQQNIQGAQIGLAGLPGLAGVAAQGFEAQFRGDEFLASILGNQQVLTQADNESRGTSFDLAQNFARAFSDSFGRSQASNESGSQSTSRTESTSESRSAGIGF